MTISLYPHQIKMVEETRAAMRNHRSVLLRSPTGSGKTVVASYIIKAALEKGSRTIFTVHRRELIEQTARTFDIFGIPYGLIVAGVTPDYERQIQIASIDTLQRRLVNLPPIDLLVVDEAVHAMAEGWMKCINHFNDAWVLLLTATPRRLDGRGLKKVADIMVHGPETRWLIDNKFLSPYRAFAPFTPDMSNSRIEQGDFKIEDAANVMDQPSITGDAVEHYKKICAGTRAIAFATNVQHSKNICEQFNGAGIPAQHIDGKMSKKERDEAIDLFRQDKIKVLTNCNIVSEGFDVPDMETAILLRPTKSISLYLQQVGRALRYKEGKVAFILDHAGNIFRHGMPCDKFNWYLSDKDKSNGKSERAAPIYQCKFCFFCFEDQFDICPNCEMEREDRKKVLQHKKGQLGEIFPGEVKNYRRASRDEIWSADTLEELLRIKTECNYKLGWVFHMCEEKGIYCDKKMLWRIYG